MPVMLVAGALDSKYAALMTTMSETAPDATTEIVPDAGHNVHLERPERFAELVGSFLRG
jgi:pimeloyl-ACP methyl ester carboxylesterase